jgi:nucleotide-binding universal stress UspA family protein
LERSPLQRLLVDYDGSDSANAAAGFGLWLASKAACALTVVHASPTPEAVPAAGLLPDAAEQVVADERDWRWRLRNLQEYAGPRADVHTQVVRGHPAGSIIAAAIESHADLVLMGSHGTGRVRGALLGSASSQVLAHAPCSVMIFREHGSTDPAAHARTVVVGIDGSASSRRALELGQALAAALGATLLLVHAYAPHASLTKGAMEAARAELRRRGGHVLAGACGTVSDPSLTIEQELVEARPADALVAVCGRRGPTILAVGSRGVGGFRELLLGGTSHRVANHAPCPVLVARAATPALSGRASLDVAVDGDRL